MAKFDSLAAQIEYLQSEFTEIVEFIHAKGQELADALAEVQRLNAILIEQEPNLITQADRDQLAAAEQKVADISAGLNEFTPNPPPA